MLVVDRRLGHRDQPFPEGADLEALLANAPSDEGSDADRHDLLALVRARQHGWVPGKGGEGNAETGAARGATTGLAAGDVDAFNRAVDAVNAGRGEDAWTLLAPVLRRASEHQTSPEAWRRLGELAAATGAFSAAEDAATRMDQADPALQKLTADLDVQRQRVALPANAAKLGVPPEREAAYVSAYRATAHEVATVDVRAARGRADAFAAAFPGSPGADILSCEVELRARRAAAATKRCEAALGKFKDAPRAHYLLGIIAAQSRRDPVAEQHLRRAILLDPAEPNAWRALAEMYRQSGAKQRLAQLADQHQALLSTPLPQ
jgi:tetratricopeptide (TPR) repeat protein